MYRRDHFLALPEDVIAFAWSAPMRDLAAHIGISDVGLRKLFRAAGVATPPQGHWNRVHAGRTLLAAPKAPARRPGEQGRVSLDGRFRSHIPESGPMDEGGPFASKLVLEDLSELYASEFAAMGRATTPRDLARPAAGLIKLLRAEEVRRAKAASSGWSWDGPRHGTPLALRQLRLLNGLFGALERRHFACEAWGEGEELRANCIIGHEAVRLRFELIGKHRTEMRGGYQRPASDLPASTPLKLFVDRKFRVPIANAWLDEPSRPLEKQIAEIAAAVVVAGEASFRQSLVEDRERREQLQRWEEEARRRRLVELRKKRIADLKESGELLRQAQEIRTLVARVEDAMLSQMSLALDEEQLVRWKAWALAEADEVDPVKSGQVLTHFHVSALDDSPANLMVQGSDP